MSESTLPHGLPVRRRMIGGIVYDTRDALLIGVDFGLPSQSFLMKGMGSGHYFMVPQYGEIVPVSKELAFNTYQQWRDGRMTRVLVEEEDAFHDIVRA